MSHANIELRVQVPTTSEATDMAKLDAGERNDLDKSRFAFPKQRKEPLDETAAAIVDTDPIATHCHVFASPNPIPSTPRRDMRA